jgi:ribosomal protection tetracycline resistance protein
VHPAFFGSAVTGAGVDPLISGIAELLPVAEGDADGPVSGTVFKVERGAVGEKIAYARMFSGTVRTRDRHTWSKRRKPKKLLPAYRFCARLPPDEAPEGITQ